MQEIKVSAIWDKEYCGWHICKHGVKNPKLSIDVCAKVTQKAGLKPGESYDLVATPIKKGGDILICRDSDIEEISTYLIALGNQSMNLEQGEWLTEEEFSECATPVSPYTWDHVIGQELKIGAGPYRFKLKCELQS